IGLFATNNHIKAYGLPASQQALTLEVGQSANLFEPGTLQAPDPSKPVYAYEATCLSVSQEGTITAKAPGTTTVTVTLMLDDVELGKTQRDVVVSTPEASASNSRSDSVKAVPPQASLVKMPFASQLTPAAVNDTIVQGHFTYTVLSVDAAKKAGTVSIKGTAPYASTDGLTIPRTITHGAAGETYTYTITELAYAAFKDYANLAGTLTLPDSLVKIGSSAVAWCKGLNGTLVIPDSVTTIGNAAFAGCRFAGHLNIPDSVTIIARAAFNGLPITTVSIPASVASVSGASFYTCSQVKSYTVAAGNQAYCSVDGILYNKQITKLLRYPSAKTGSYDIPSTVTAIEDEALADSCLVSIEIPSFVSTWSVYMFASSPALQSVVLGAGISGIPVGTFGWCRSLNSITAYGNVSDISQHADTFALVNKTNITIYLPTGIVGGRTQAARQETWRAEGFTLFADAPNKSITFNSQGGTAVANQVVVPQAKASNPGDPSKKGYTFAGWYQNAACTGAPWDFNSPVTNSITLYAKWVANTYSVAFNANGAAGSMNSQPFTYDAPAQALLANTFTKTGYTFAGWTEAQAGTGTRYTDAQAVSNLSAQQGATVTLYAQWMPNTYTIAFNGNNATGGTTAQLPMVYDVPASLTTNGFTRTGYTFAGWNTAANGAGTSFAPGASVNNLTPTPGATVTLYAQWNLVISVDVPIEQSFSIDAKGGITSTTTGASFFASSTVELLRVSSIKCTKGAGADSIFKTPGDHSKIAITMAAGGPVASVPLVGDAWVQPGGANLFVIPAQTPGPTPVAGKLPVSFGLNIPEGVSYSYVNPASPEPFATLVFSVEALK
ncbi:MAG: InlB B-repeat-containing protein, partial [Raoultibacter sp.]